MTARRRPIPILAIGGTHSWPLARRHEWYQPGSAWWQLLAQHGYAPAGDDPFTWSTGIDGLLPGRKLTLWQAAGVNLYHYCVPPLARDRRLPAAHTHIVCHSHALQVVVFACVMKGLKVNTLTSIGSPIRRDVPYAAARPFIRYWQHVHSDASDRWQWLGAIGDGAIGLDRACPYADRNVALPGVGHSGILTDPALFDRWDPLLAAIRVRQPYVVA